MEEKKDYRAELFYEPKNGYDGLAGNAAKLMGGETTLPPDAASPDTSSKVMVCHRRLLRGLQALPRHFAHGARVRAQRRLAGA